MPSLQRLRPRGAWGWAVTIVGAIILAFVLIGVLNMNVAGLGR